MTAPIPDSARPVALVARLRSRGQWVPTKRVPLIPPLDEEEWRPDDLCAEAADEIERLRALVLELPDAEHVHLTRHPDTFAMGEELDLEPIGLTEGPYIPKPRRYWYEVDGAKVNEPTFAVAALREMAAQAAATELIDEWAHAGPWRMNPDDVTLLVDEIHRLRRWKAEAVGVLDDHWAAWDAAGRPGQLGQSIAQGMADEIARLRALVLVTAARATADTTEHVDNLERSLRDMVTATGPLRAGDASSDVLFKLLDARTRACELLDLDPAGHDWTPEP